MYRDIHSSKDLRSMSSRDPPGGVLRLNSFSASSTAPAVASTGAGSFLFRGPLQPGLFRFQGPELSFGLGPLLGDLLPGGLHWPPSSPRPPKPWPRPLYGLFLPLPSLASLGLRPPLMPSAKPPSWPPELGVLRKHPPPPAPVLGLHAFLGQPPLPARLRRWLRR